MFPFDRIASEYAQHRQPNPAVLEAICRDGNLSINSCVLEVGCGTGNYVAAISARVGCHCWGLDPSPGMLAEATDLSPGIALQVGMAERTGLPSDAFDLVFSVDAIHHFQDPSGYFHEALRVLKPGGRLCTVTSSEWMIRNYRPLAAYFPESVEIDLARVPPTDLLLKLAGRAGFREASEHETEYAGELSDASPYRAGAFSALHLISKAGWLQGVERMERDLRAGPVPCVFRRVLMWGRR